MRVVFIVLAAALLAFSCSTGTEDPVTAGDLIGRVSQDRIEDTIRGLSGAEAVMIGGSLYTFTTRATGSGEPITKALQYVYELFESYGLTVEYHPWSGGGYSCSNVIATRTGTLLPGEIVIICANLDCVPASGPAPGADDNASGCAGVLECARIMSGQSFERTVRFVLFTGSEQGFLGSGAYADAAADAGDTVTAVYYLRMIGWDDLGGPVLRLHTRSSPSPGYDGDLTLADAFSQAAADHSIGVSPVLDADGLTTGDHKSFWDHGYSAVCVMEDDVDDFNPHYHMDSDTTDRLNMTYLTNIVRAVLGTVIGCSGLM